MPSVTNQTPPTLRRDFQLAVFLKAPTPGTVKTRLAEDIGPEKACEIYRQLVETTMHAIRVFDPVTLCYTPDEKESECRRWLRPGWDMLPQGSGNLGERISRVCRTLFDKQKAPVIVIGTDCPWIRAEDIEQSLQKLEESDVVIGPAVDGGYWLIGLRKPITEIFRNIDWSTSSVLSQTLEATKRIGLQTSFLRELEDIDDLPSWNRYFTGL